MQIALRAQLKLDLILKVLLMACQYLNANRLIDKTCYFDGYKSLVYTALFINGYNQRKWHIIHNELTVVAKRDV